MKNISFILIGILFGITMTKSEAISWYRIQEMFRFQSIHMFGIIGVAVILGAILFFIIKKYQIKTFEGAIIQIKEKPKNYKAAILGGSIFGLGWAMTGACPGPLYVLVGNGYWIILVIIASALLGTLCYGMLRNKLPH